MLPIALNPDMEKYCLKWNDFQVNVSKSFSSLRKEKDFFDVTLVSDDEQHISAHKVVLSASSDFFKGILKKATHSSPMIYLSGVNSAYLSLVMDYIYEGEVKLFQEDLDNFLDTAQKLKIDGLIGNEQDNTSNDNINEASKEHFEGDTKEFNTSERDFSVIERRKPLENSFSSSREVAINASNIDAKAAVDELVLKIENGYQCKACGKTSNKTSTSDIRRHAETHIEGLSFECPICQKSLKSRSLLAVHKNQNHKHTLF